jgi:hypothetical protein
MLGSPVLVERKDPLFAFPTFCEINSSVDKLVTLGL